MFELLMFDNQRHKGRKKFLIILFWLIIFLRKMFVNFLENYKIN